MQRLLIDQQDITQTRLEVTNASPLAPGQVRIALRRFALTANNVTYAAAGFVIGYWQFFPSSQEGQGLLPVWGFGEVVETTTDALSLGTRLYGFFPLAQELVINPESIGENVVLDAAPHRASLPIVYNRYAIVPERPAHDEALQALLQPLLATSFLLQDWLTDNGFFGAQQVIIGSASSKTGLGLSKYLAELAPRPVRIVGLTSARNAPFVEGLGACDQVLTYDEVEALDKIPSVYVDMAGNADVKTRLHSHLADVLTHSCAVGTSHWDKFAPKLALAGPKPQFFFAPAQIEKRRADWGPGVIDRKIGEAWRRLAREAAAWLDVKEHDGLTAAPAIYDQIATGTASPRDGHVFTLGSASTV